MVWHQAEPEKLNSRLLLSVEKELKEGAGVPRLAEDAHSPVPTVEHMINDAANSGPRGSWHGETVQMLTLKGKFDGCHLFTFPVPTTRPRES
jgi:hypothetical protein